MKFLKLFLTLAFTSYVYSENTIIFNHRNGLYMKANTDKYLNKLTKECQEELKKDNVYYDCVDFDNVNMTNYEDKCRLFNTKKCIDYFKDPLSVVPKCANDETFKLDIIRYKGYDPTKNDICLRSAEGKLCPFGEDAINDKPITEEGLLANCESKACTQHLIESFERSIRDADINEKIHQESARSKGAIIDASYTIRKLGEYLELLKSEECTSKTKDDLATTKYIGGDVKDDDLKSSATTIKVSSTFISILGLLYYYLLID